MTKAKAPKKEKLVERVVVGPKGIHCHDKNGERIFAKIGDTIYLPARSAKKFEQYLEIPSVAKAKAEVKAAEAEAEADDAAEDEGSGEEEGGDSDES